MKPFIADRYESVVQQLAGERPSGPDIKGSGNGVTRGLCAGGF